MKSSPVFGRNMRRAVWNGKRRTIYENIEEITQTRQQAERTDRFLVDTSFSIWGRNRARRDSLPDSSMVRVFRHVYLRRRLGVLRTLARDRREYP